MIENFEYEEMIKGAASGFMAKFKKSNIRPDFGEIVGRLSEAFCSAKRRYMASQNHSASFKTYFSGCCRKVASDYFKELIRERELFTHIDSDMLMESSHDQLEKIEICMAIKEAMEPFDPTQREICKQMLFPEKKIAGSVRFADAVGEHIGKSTSYVYRNMRKFKEGVYNGLDN